MAKEAKAAEETESAAPPKKGKKLLIIIVLAVVLILGVGGGAAFFLLKGNAHPEGEEGEVAAESAKKKDKGGKEVPPVYMALDAFTVNLIPENGE